MGLFDSFDNLDTIPVENIAVWLPNPPTPDQLNNYLANRILYPQASPLTAAQIQIDLAILREAIKINSHQSIGSDTFLQGNTPFLNATLRKILIPAKFLEYVPDLRSLAWVFIDALLLNKKKASWFEDLWTIVLTDEVDEIIGSVILPRLNNAVSFMELSLRDKKYKIQKGSLTVLPCVKQRFPITYNIQNGLLLGKTTNSIEVYGGKLGLVIDGRNI